MEEQQRKDQIEVDHVAVLNKKMLVFTNYKSNPIQTTTVEEWEEALAAIKSIKMTVANWEDFLPSAMECQKDAIVGLEDIIKQRKKYDSDQAELKRLQDEQEEQRIKDEEAEQESEKQRQREEDEAHRAEIHLDITLDLRKQHFAEEVIKAIIKHVSDGDIRHIKIEY